MKVLLTKDQKIRIKRSKDIFPIMSEILRRENKIRRRQEFFWVVALNNSNQIDNIELVALGATNTVSVGAIEVFSIPLQKRCRNIILVHNHPSGRLKPSADDIAFTKKIRAAADVLEMVILDHIIITEKDYLSLSDEYLI